MYLLLYSNLILAIVIVMNGQYYIMQYNIFQCTSNGVFRYNGPLEVFYNVHIWLLLKSVIEK